MPIQKQHQGVILGGFPDSKGRRCPEPDTEPNVIEKLCEEQEIQHLNATDPILMLQENDCLQPQRCLFSQPYVSKTLEAPQMCGRLQIISLELYSV